MQKKIVLFIFVFAFSIHLSFSKTALKNKSDAVNDTTIINIDLHNKQLASFYFSDEYGDTAPPFFLSAKNHIKKLDIRHPVLIIDSYHQIPFLIYPGERLILQVDSEGLPVFNVKDNETRNNELYLFVACYKQLFSKLNAFLYITPFKNFKLPVTENDFQKVIKVAKSDSAKRMDFFKEYQKTSRISNSFAVYAKKFLRYLCIINILEPTYYGRVNLDKLPLTYTNYIDSVIKEEINCDSCLDNESYRRALLNSRHYLTRKVKQQNARFSNYYDTIALLFSGTNKRYLLFTALKEHQPGANNNYEARYSTFINEKDDGYSKYLIKQRDLFNQFKRGANIKKEIVDTKGNKFTVDELLLKYRGYWIYLDVWASWCSPCRANMPLTEKLKANFKDKKILFLDISIDDNPSDWKKAMLDERIDEKLNYLLLDQNHSDLKKRYKINTIPRYMIINPNGVVVDDDAIYPNNPKIAKVLSDYLTQ